MPFLGVLPERLALFEPQPLANVAVNDAHAWRLNPQHRHVYNKLDIALSQGLKAAPCGVSPRLFAIDEQASVFVKPIVNLAGMSLGAGVVKAGEVCTAAGSFWCEFLQGQQTSTDCLMLEGEVLWFAHTRGAQERDKQRPIYWQIGVELPAIEAPLRAFLQGQLEAYTGLCNVEMIGGKVIEVHLRGSNGFFDFYGPEFMPSWVRLMDCDEWSDPGPVNPGVVYSVFSDDEPRDWPGLEKRLGAAYPDMAVQRDRNVADRVAIIRGDSLDSAQQIAKMIRASIGP